MEGLTFSCSRNSIFMSQTFKETKLESNEKTREESYGEIKLESREQSCRGTNLESNEKTKYQSYEERS